MRQAGHRVSRLAKGNRGLLTARPLQGLQAATAMSLRVEDFAVKRGLERGFGSRHPECAMSAPQVAGSPLIKRLRPNVRAAPALPSSNHGGKSCRDFCAHGPRKSIAAPDMLGSLRSIFTGARPKGAGGVPFPARTDDSGEKRWSK